MLEGMSGGWTNNASLFHVVFALAGRDFTQTRSVMILLLAAATLAVAALRLPPAQGILATAAAILFLASNCHPWYLTWLLPFLAIQPFAPLLLWTALAPLAYHHLPGYQLLGQWQEDPFFLYLEYVPVYAMLLAAPWLARYERSRSRPAAASGASPPLKGSASNAPWPFSRTTGKP
jgi:hypothetical protein